MCKCGGYCHIKDFHFCFPVIYFFLYEWFPKRCKSLSGFRYELLAGLVEAKEVNI